jgi:hypothetical protein
MAGMSLPPLEDPTYQPLNPPVNGVAPDVIALWGPRSQLRWFDRFRNVLTPQSYKVWDRFYCVTVQHRGNCCTSCVEDEEYDACYSMWPRCCCRALNEEDPRAIRAEED